MLIHWNSSEGKTGNVQATLKNGLYQGSITNPPAGKLTITIKAYDKAGNMQTETLTVEVTQPIVGPKGFLEKHPMLPYITLGIVALIVIIVGVYLWKKRGSEKVTVEE